MALNRFVCPSLNLFEVFTVCGEVSKRMCIGGCRIHLRLLTTESEHWTWWRWLFPLFCFRGLKKSYPFPLFSQLAKWRALDAEPWVRPCPPFSRLSRMLSENQIFKDSWNCLFSCVLIVDTPLCCLGSLVFSYVLELLYLYVFITIWTIEFRVQGFWFWDVLG